MDHYVLRLVFAQLFVAASRWACCRPSHYKRWGLLRHIVHVSTEAKPTHKKYGTRSSAAQRLVRQKAAPVAMISASRIRTSAVANAPRCHAKKHHDQSALAASCAPNKLSASPLAPGERQTSQAATPMSAYSADQTGPNSHAGGAQDGLVNCA